MNQTENQLTLKITRLGQALGHLREARADIMVAYPTRPSLVNGLDGEIIELEEQLKYLRGMRKGE